MDDGRDLGRRVTELERRLTDAEAHANKALVYVAILFFAVGLIVYKLWGGIF
jgi:hypothetical protein